MPDLRPDCAAGLVDIPGDVFPAVQRRAVKEGNAGLVARGGTIDHCSLGQDQSDTALGAATIIIGLQLAGHAIGGKTARHRRHDDTIGQGHGFDGERREQYFARLRHKSSPLHYPWPNVSASVMENPRRNCLRP